MDILDIRIEGFRSFQNATAFKLPEPGLVLVSGENKEEPDLEGNGVGKSSLFESIYWALFGKTSRNLKAGNIANWKGEDNCAVSIHGRVYGKAFTLTRTWKPNTLKLNGLEVDQPTLELKLGVTSDVFRHSHYFPQFTESFLDLKPEAKLHLLVEVLKLHVWERASTVANDTAKETSMIVSKNEGRLTEVSVELIKSKDIQCLIDLRDSFDARKKAESAGVEYRINKAKKNQALVQQQIKSQLESLEAEEKKLGAMNYTVSARSRKANLLIQKKSEALSNYTLAVRQEKDGELRAVEIAHLKGTCLTCGQHIPEKHLLSEVAKAESLLASLHQKRCDAEAALKSAGDALAEANESLTKILVTLRMRRDDVAKEQQLLGTMETRAQLLAQEIKNSEAEKANTLNRSNPYTEQIEQQRKKAFNLGLKKAVLQKSIAQGNSTLTDTEFWVKGFKEVRLFVLHDVLTQLEVEVNQVLHQIGLLRWRVEFDVEKENKSGGVSRGFITYIINPDVPDRRTPWEAWSGGESQRLRLAGAMGFANLVHSVSGQAPNFELWDEPSNWLSNLGITQMLDALRDRAAKYERTILLADHRSLNYSDFSEVVKVVKDADGSKLL